MLELLALRERQYRRETKLIGVLQFVSSTVWKALFNKVADSLERSTENEDEYMIHEREPITNAFVSAPADISQLNCAAYIAGIISGVLNGASFVSLHWAVNYLGRPLCLEKEFVCIARIILASQMRTKGQGRTILLHTGGRMYVSVSFFRSLSFMCSHGVLIAYKKLIRPCSTPFSSHMISHFTACWGDGPSRGDWGWAAR